MYPKTYFDLFLPFPRNSSVFVAMPFSDVFNERWEQVIKPAIEESCNEEQSLNALRVDARLVSDSILTEIEAGIADSLLIFADVTCSAVLNGMPVRNGNVMYELGVATSIRNLDEILIFRSDREELAPDFSDCKVYQYDPDQHPETARSLLRSAITNALDHRDDLRNKTVAKIAPMVDGLAFSILAHCAAPKGYKIEFLPDLVGEIGNSSNRHALRRLLDLGLVFCDFSEADFSDFKPGQVGQFDRIAVHRTTELGLAVYEYLVQPMKEQLRAVAERFGVRPKRDDDD